MQQLQHFHLPCPADPRAPPPLCPSLLQLQLLPLAYANFNMHTHKDILPAPLLALWPPLYSSLPPLPFPASSPSCYLFPPKLLKPPSACQPPESLSICGACAFLTSLCIVIKQKAVRASERLIDRERKRDWEERLGRE